MEGTEVWGCTVAPEDGGGILASQTPGPWGALEEEVRLLEATALAATTLLALGLVELGLVAMDMGQVDQVGMEGMA